MGDQRQRFSFRLPWSAPSATTRRPSPVTNNPSRATSNTNQPNANPATASQGPPSQSQGSSQTPKPLPRSSTSTKTSSKPTSTESPNVPRPNAIKTKNPAPTSTSPSQPTVESRRPSLTTPQPVRPAAQTSEQVVEPSSALQAQATPKQPPSAPSPTNFQSRTSSQTTSPSHIGNQRRATSKSPPPSNASPQSRAPSHTSLKSKNASQSPLASPPKSTVSETDSQPTSPSRSPPSPDIHLSGKNSKNFQPTTTQKGSQPQPQAHPEKDNTGEVISKAPIESTLKPIAVPTSQQTDPLSTTPTPMTAEETNEKFKKVLHSNSPMLHGKQSTTASHQSNKNRAGASRQKPMATNGEGISMQKEIKNDISKLTQKMASEQRKAVSIITLVGENKGATMQIGSQKEGMVHIHRGYKLNPDEPTEAASEGDKSSIDKRPEEANTKEDQMTKAYMNSNSQGINNSIVFKSSITERNPGVHLTLTQNPTEPIKTTTNANQLVAQKVEASITPSQKLTYETTIRRRCLRGLLMESSDSDPDNPEKPRRHGCRCSYGDLDKDKEIHLL